MTRASPAAHCVTLDTDRGPWGLPVKPAMTEGCPMKGMTMGYPVGAGSDGVGAGSDGVGAGYDGVGAG